MKLSDLLRSEVVDRDGKRLGTVEDVRVVQDGPLLLPFGAAFRVEGLIVAPRHDIGTRLGYSRGDIKGPWLLRTLFSRMERRSQYVPWERVEAWDGTVVRLDGTAREVRAASQWKGAVADE